MYNTDEKGFGKINLLPPKAVPEMHDCGDALVIIFLKREGSCTKSIHSTFNAL